MIVLPWPPSELSPNARVHWSVKSRAARKMKNDCWALTKATGIKVSSDGFVLLKITFRPPTKRRQDLDNMLARAKSCLDGVALGLGVDDSRFRLALEIGEPITGGQIEIRL